MQLNGTAGPAAIGDCKTQCSKKAKGSKAWSEDRRAADDYLSAKFPKKMDVYYEKSWEEQKADTKFKDVRRSSIMFEFLGFLASLLLSMC